MMTVKDELENMREGRAVARIVYSSCIILVYIRRDWEKSRKICHNSGSLDRE